jgi:hypothetical protein
LGAQPDANVIAWEADRSEDLVGDWRVSRFMPISAAALRREHCLRAI